MTRKIVILLHAVGSIMFPSTSIITRQEKTTHLRTKYSSTWHVFTSPSAETTTDAVLTVWSDILCSPWVGVAVVVAVVGDHGLSVTFWVVLYRAHKTEMVCLETPKCLATVCWVAPACNPSLALLCWIVTELPGTHAFLRVAFLHFNTNVSYG